jgi:inorganic pyrophosphatase
MGDGYGISNNKDIVYAGRLFIALAIEKVPLQQMPTSIDTARFLWRFYLNNAKGITDPHILKGLNLKVLEIWNPFKEAPPKGTKKIVEKKMKSDFPAEYEKMKRPTKDDTEDEVCDMLNFEPEPESEPVLSIQTDTTSQGVDDDDEDEVIADVNENEPVAEIVHKYQDLKRKYEDLKAATSKYNLLQKKIRNSGFFYKEVKHSNFR